MGALPKVESRGEKMSEIALKDLLADIHILNKELTVFEHRYSLLSETFYDWYCQGHEPEHDAWVMDLAEWAGLYKSRQRLIAQCEASVGV